VVLNFNQVKAAAARIGAAKNVHRLTPSKGCSSMPPTGYSHIPIQPIYQNCFPKMQVLSRMNCKALAV